ncbi:MAG: single-stranded-DNA-specific exonuclease RecJ [Eubacteriales bacterium]|nr:single-stranded-DNA-specific exonuclease RecJ [Eubacteriales bacterium]
MLYYSPMELFVQNEAYSGQAPRIKGVSPMLAALLAKRGVVGAAAVRAFLEPNTEDLFDPFLFSGMADAVSRVRQALDRHERICVYGDYDVDGVCAVSTLVMCLRRLGAEVCYHIPSRHNEGYGMNIGAVEALAEQGVRLIITVDNGVKAYDEAARCYELGMELVITDHHISGETLPRCAAAVCHTLPGDGYPNKDICGAATAFKLVQALAGFDEAKRYLPLAGLATVADLVPLLGENRVIVSEALRMLNRGEAPAGLLALAREVGGNGIFTSRHLAFGFAPRINAAGRLGDASLCVELLCGEDEAETARIAAALSALNAQRQSEELSICAEAYAALDASDLTERRTIVLKGDWNSGVIGIAATRVVERYYRPAILFSEKDGVLTGSARSIDGVHLYAALLQCADLFVRFGGHAAAAGVTMDASHYEAFCERFEAAVRFLAPQEAAFVPKRAYELEAPLEDVNMGLAEDIERLAPFGAGNPRPLFRIRGAYLRNLKRMGDGSHLRGTLAAGTATRSCTLFNMRGAWDALLAMDRCDLLCAPAVDVWNGARSLQIQLKAVRASLPDDTDAYIDAHQTKFVDAFSRNILYNITRGDLAFSHAAADEWLKAALDEHGAGTLTLCFTPAGAKRLLCSMDVYARMDVAFFCEPKTSCAYNAAVLAPVLDAMEPWRYRRILVYDTPVFPGVARRLQEIAPHAKLVLAKTREADAAALREALYLDREGMALMYRAFRLAKRRFYNREELADFLARETRLSRTLCALGADILLELGFAHAHNGIELIPDAPKKPLEESATYRALQALRDAQ